MLAPWEWQDAVAAILLVASQAVFVGGCHRSAGRLVPPRRPIRLVATLLVAWTAIVITAAIWGTIGWLVPWLFYGSLTALGAFALWWLPQPMRGSQQRTGRPSSKPWRARVRRRAGDGLLLTAVAYVLLYGVLRLPCDWDSLAYHLPIIDQWIQSGSLLVRDCAFWYVPGNNELIGFWWVAGFSGDFLVGLNNLPVFILLVAASWELLVALRVDWPLRGLALTSLLASDVVTRQLISQENDVAVAALFVSAALFGWRWAERAGRGDGFLFAISVGLLAGVKYYALGYAAAVMGLTVAAVLLRRGWKQAIVSTLMALGGCLLLAGVWYARNWVWTGTPLFPKGFEGLGMPDQWAEMRPKNATSTLQRGGTLEIWKLLGQAWLAQAGPATTVAMVTSVVAAGWLLLSPKRGGASQSRNFFAVLLLFAALGVYWITPNVIETVAGTRNMLRMQYHSVRFGTAPAAIATIVVAAALSGIKPKALRATGVAVSIVLIAIDLIVCIGPQIGFATALREWGVLMHWPPGHSVQPVTLGLLIVDSALAVTLWHCIDWSHRGQRRLAIGGLAGIVMWAAATLSSRWHEGFDEHFLRTFRLPVASETEEWMEPGDRLCACVYRYYPLLGSRRQHRVKRPLYLPNPWAIENYLRRERTSLLISFDQDHHWTQTYAGVSPFVNQHPRAFEQLKLRGNYVWRRIDLEELER